MPELPEVESIRRNLNKVVQHEKIKSVNVFYRPIVSNDLSFETKVTGQTIEDILRKGKYLFFILNDYVMVSHLRMEGKYMMDHDLDPKHTHVLFQFESGHQLQYHDTRKFGRFELINKSDFDINSYNDIAKEPFDITKEELFDKLKNKTISIKEAILDQRIVSGIGNIYANEILYRSKIHPAKPAMMVTLDEVDLLIKQSKWVLDKAVRMGGTTIDTFESLGHKGEFQQELRVHGKQGEICPLCESVIQKVQHKGRGTYYCPGCQKSYVVAITGGIATGKSTAVNYLKKKGFKVADSDQIVQSLYQDEVVKDWLKKTFDAKASDGSVDRTKIAQIVFSNPRKKERLEAYLHPLVFEKIEAFKNHEFAYLKFLDIPLLFETRYKGFDKSLLIYASRENQLKRLIDRNHFTIDDAKKRIKAQMPISKKMRLADAIIDNNGSIKDLYKKIDLYLEIF